uniref:DRBM domain-containing protein n=1 Tax=Hyaloperonospora arabidopsidis (strain Emoy2) TaxID=559515 RepID=M4BJ17_HYAAE
MADHEMMMARLRAALSASDKQTQQFLQPLLSLRGVQDLLLTFVQDASRSFEDWVWDPHVRQTLLHLQQQHEQKGPHDEAIPNPNELDRVYARAMREHMAEVALADQENETPRAFLEAATAAQDEGKQKFQARFYYAARNAFLKSLDAVEKHQVSEYYGHSVPPIKWDDDEIQARYVQLCNNVAICSIKLKDLSLIQEYAMKALSVDEMSIKALYALAKGRLIEHRHNEAEEVIEKALGFYPDKAQFLNLRKDVAAARRKWDLNQAEVATLGASQLAAAAGVEKTIQLTALTPEEQELQHEKERQVRVDATRLPSREEDMQLAASRLHVYFMKMKQQMAVEIRPLHNADAGEEPLFECTIANGETGEVLASGVQGPSKKSVKNEASKIAIDKLWHDKQAAGKLLPEELAELERFERGKAGSHLLMDEPVVSTEAPQPCGEAGSGDHSPQVPIRITCLERQLQPLQLLNQLTQRGSLLARFDILDVSPSKDVTEFECKGYLNDGYVGAATAISKKKARAEVARQMLAAAYEQNLIFVYDGSADNEDKDGTYDGKDLDRNEQGLASDG